MHIHPSRLFKPEELLISDRLSDPTSDVILQLQETYRRALIYGDGGLKSALGKVATEVDKNTSEGQGAASHNRLKQIDF